MDRATVNAAPDATGFYERAGYVRCAGGGSGEGRWCGWGRGCERILHRYTGGDAKRVATIAAYGLRFQARMKPQWKHV